MLSSISNEDLRTIRTKKALSDAMYSLMKSSNFKKITIKEICQEAQISRATFYAHFTDKYDLLKLWITELWPQGYNSNDDFEQMEKMINSHILKNASVIKNLVNEADSETFDILFDSILSTINVKMQENHPKSIVLSHFYAGGIISYLSWQLKNKFPPDVQPMNKYFYEIIEGLRNWQSK